MARTNARASQLEVSSALPRVEHAAVVRLATRHDLRSTAELHARLLPTGFFPKLGTRFLRTYHATFASGPAAVALVADDDGGPVGFLVGTVDNERHYRWLTRHRAPQLAIAGARALMRDPTLLVTFLRTRSRRYLRSLLRRLRRRPVTVSAQYLPATGGGGRTAHGAPPAVAVLTHVAVAPHARGTGTGRQLVDAFVRTATLAGAAEARLISPVTTGAPAFYRRLGWRAVGRRAASDGTLVEEFRLSL